ncbi:MAG: arginase family protein [Gemmataceae bacterium]
MTNNSPPTRAIFSPFALFGHPGTARGAELLADAFRELLADNRREEAPTRALAYANRVRMREVLFENMRDYTAWRQRSRRLVGKAWGKNEFLLWISGNHLGVLPVYDELAAAPESTLVIQFDAHLDIYNLSDCATAPSHGNFLLHVNGQLPRVWNVGSRDLLLRQEYVPKYYPGVFPAAELAIDPAPALHALRQLGQQAERVFIDIDCDVFDPAYFPAVAQPVPFGLSTSLFLRFLDAVWSDRVIGLALSEFDPANDDHDRCLETLMWLLEYVLLRRYEGIPSD